VPPRHKPLEELTLPGEIWKPVTLSPHYKVSSYGRVVTHRYCAGLRKGFKVHEHVRLLKQTKTVRKDRDHYIPYFKVRIYVACGKWIQKQVHHLVLEAFVGPRGPGQQCRHLDDNQANNRLDNLCWGTPLENAEDKRANNRIARGERSGASKLTEDNVRFIWQRYALGETQKYIAELMGCSDSTINSIITGKTWKHVKV